MGAAVAFGSLNRIITPYVFVPPHMLFVHLHLSFLSSVPFTLHNVVRPNYSCAMNVPYVFSEICLLSFVLFSGFPLAHASSALVLNESLLHCNPESKDSFSTDTLSVWPRSWRDGRADVACECLWSDQLFASSSTYLKSLGCLVNCFAWVSRS